MHPESITPTGAAIPRNGVLVLTGYGLRVAVERGHLTVSDGRGRERREGRFPRASRQLRRLVVIGHTGTISFDALRWLRDVGCAFVQIDADGTVIAAVGAAGLDDARLRRAQAMAASNGTGLEVTRDLLARKLAGQAAVLDRLGTPLAADASVHVHRSLDALPAAATSDRLRSLEADAAVRYWGAWTAVPIRWARRDAVRVPEHWRAFGARSSPLTGSPRSAANPANALLNYAYAILEAEARIALLAVGLDPGMGVLHADQRARDSLALDLMEAVRPTVDGWVLDALAGRTFAKADFHETRQGSCRLMPPLAKLVAETAPRWAAAVAPVAEGIARAFVTSASAGSRAAAPLPTPLTGDNRSAERNGIRRAERREPASNAVLPPACLLCGVVLGRTGRDLCDDCLPERQTEQASMWAAAGPSTLIQRRAEGRDPAHGGEAGRKRGARNAAHMATVTSWKETHDEPADGQAFERDILPRLRSVPLRVMAEATGLSLGYCSFMRRGHKVPHQRHWAALARLGGEHCHH